MNDQLLITNIGHIISIIITGALAILVFSRGTKKRINQVFLFFGIATVIWEVSYLLGINIADPSWSRFAFMWNLASIFITIFNAHLVLLLVNRYEKQRIILWIMYSLGIILVGFFAIFPDLFLQLSKPKLYFINFFVPGKYYYIGDILFFTVLLYTIINLISAYIKADRVLKNRLRYFILSLFIAYSVSLSSEFLLYGVNVDPFITFIFGIYAIPMAYAIVEYNLIDINIIAKRAFWYAIGVAGVALTVSFIGSSNESITRSIPGFPHWIIPTISGIIAVSLAAFVWKKIREVDILKDEFINIIMHKFRTPLTYIKWAVETLKTNSLPTEQRKELENIENSNSKLVELTNTMVNLANMGSSGHSYNFNIESMSIILEKIISDYKSRLDSKKIEFATHIAHNIPNVVIDRKRIEFVITTLLDNAITYTPSGGKIDLWLESVGEDMILKVKDTGIGISKEDLHYIFSKFFRGSGVKVDTEGMGIGLFIARDIVRRHRGEIYVESEGTGRGSVFSVHLPLKR